MNLEDALKLPQNQPPAEERASILREQLGRFRREFYNHLTDLKRVAAYEAKAKGDVPEDFAQAKQGAERALDTIHDAISTTLDELKTLDPDAE